MLLQNEFFLFFVFFSRHHTYESRLLKILMSALYAHAADKLFMNIILPSCINNVYS